MKIKLPDFNPWRMFLRWIGRWLMGNCSEDATEIKKGMDAVKPAEHPLPTSWLKRVFHRKQPEIKPHIQTPIFRPDRPVRHDIPAGQRGGLRK